MKLFILITLMSITTFSCAQNSVERSVPKDSKHLAVYVEAKSKSRGISSGEFGEIVVLDIDTKIKYYITRDNFYDTDPKFSPDGFRILFQSNRDQDITTLKIKGMSGPYNQYIYDLEKGTISKVNILYETNRPKEYRSTLRNIGWLPKGDEIYFNFNHNEIYIYDLLTNKIETVYTFPDFNIIDNISLSQSNLFAFSFRNDLLTFENSGLAIYNREGDSTDIFSSYSTTIGEWAGADEKIPFRGGKETNFSIMEYDYESKTSKKLFEFPRNLNLVSQLFYVGDDKIVFLAGEVEKEYQEGKERLLFKNNEIILYDLNTNKFEWLTNEMLEKEALDVIWRN